VNKNYSHGLDPSENGYRIPTTNTSHNNYNIPYDAVSVIDSNIDRTNTSKLTHSKINSEEGNKLTLNSFKTSTHQKSSMEAEEELGLWEE
jgi:hypothetical protein